MQNIHGRDDLPVVPSVVFLFSQCKFVVNSLVRPRHRLAGSTLFSVQKATETMPQHIGQKTPMHKSKTLQEREKELQPLMATPAGRDQLHELASRYQASSGKLKPAKTSVITYILIHERKQGMICL